MVQHGAHDRLPWLDSPRPVARPRSRRAGPARHARTPLLVLLGLFAASLLAVMAFLTGRGTAPRPVASAEYSAPRPTTAPPPAARPAPIEPPRLSQAAPATPPAASGAQAVPRAVALKPRPKQTYRSASASRAVKARRVAARSARARQRQAAIRRNPIPIPAGLAAAPRRITPAPVQAFAGPRGKVVQLGAFVTMRQADAAWWRLLRAYPYLGTLPRMVSWIGPTPGRPRYYRVRLAASSRREARALCNNLHRIGRGCMVV